MTEFEESIQKAVHDAAFLTSDILTAHATACNPLAEIILFDLIQESQAFRDKIERLSEALNA
jgi:hypothetical protein